MSERLAGMIGVECKCNAPGDVVGGQVARVDDLDLCNAASLTRERINSAGLDRHVGALKNFSGFRQLVSLQLQLLPLQEYRNRDPC